MSAVKVAFLYSEVAGYFLSCAAELSEKAEVLIFRWPVNKEAPFDLSRFEKLTIIDRTGYDQEQLEKKLRDFDPSILVCSGWLDQGYTAAAKKFKKRIPVVLTLDNHWTGSLKQRLAAVTSPLHLKRTFTHAWVPGEPQAVFAGKLGFRGKKLLRNFYCADVKLFNKQYEETFKAKQGAFPKRFLYVARYVEHKGIFEMWNAFAALQNEQPNDWELWCIGTGDEWENRLESDKIRHLGFVQPDDLGQFIAQAGVYILPSKFEPWGVSVQEFAISGFPLLISSAVGAKWTYLKEGINGFEFVPGSVDAIKMVMKKVMALTDQELIKMGEASHQTGVSFTPSDWTENLLSILK